MCFERDGVQRVSGPRDMKILALCAAALRQFFDTHSERIESGSFDPVCETCRLSPESIEVRLSYRCRTTALFDIDEEFWAAPAVPDMPGLVRVGRNDPCPCGSGRKYKKRFLAGGAGPFPSTANHGRTRG